MDTLGHLKGVSSLAELEYQPRRLRRLLWPVFICLLILALLASVAPFVNAAAFTHRIERALEASLARQVTFERAHFTLFTGPGFSLENVTIQEDPKYGLEPFAHVPKLEVRLRLDRLLLGHIAISSLRLVQPSLNLVQRGDGSWNVVELVDRLRPSSRLPINVFPAVQVSEGRLDLKIGMRKTTLYVTNSDLSIYPEPSGKLYIRFSGSPARTDRAGNPFGHLRGTANWYLKPASDDANQLEADVTLDPSNLSEVTTLFEGEDAGVHGTISSHLRIEGPADAIRLSGEVRLGDVHRWDLMPSSGDDWRIRCAGNINLVAHHLEFRTLPVRSGDVSPVTLEMRINDYLKHPTWTVLTTFNRAPAAELLPFGRRMGVSFPEDLDLEGTVDGVIGYSNLNALSGEVSVTNAVARLPKLPPIRASTVNARVSPDHIHVDPAMLQIPESGMLQVGGDYDLFRHRSLVSLNFADFRAAALKSTLGSWFDGGPDLSALRDGRITGQVAYGREGSDPPTWNGQFRFSEAKLTLPGLATPLTGAAGRLQFDNGNLELDRFSAQLGNRRLSATFEHASEPNVSQRVHVDMPAADLTEIETALEPTLRAQGLLARLGVAQRRIPNWLADRDVQGDLNIKNFSIDHLSIGSLKSHLIWQGTSIRFSPFVLSMPEGSLQAAGELNVSANRPRYDFSAKVAGFPWRGGALDASGKFQTDGTGAEALRHLRADGQFAGQNLSVSADDTFEKVSGAFHFSFSDGWPDLRVADVQVSQDDEAWTGDASSQSDGKLIINLENSGHQRHVISTLAGGLSSASDNGGEAPLR